MIDKFESFKPKEKGNGGEDEGQVEYINSNGGSGKPCNEKGKSSNLKEKRVRYNAFYVTVYIW